MFDFFVLCFYWSTGQKDQLWEVFEADLFFFSLLLLMSLNIYFVDKNQQEEDSLKLKAVILYLSFTQNSTLFTVGLDKGYQIFSCEGVKLQEKEGFSTGGIGVVELKDSNTKVVSLGKKKKKSFNFSEKKKKVGGGKEPGFSKNKAIVWDYEAKKSVAELSCPKDIHSLKMVVSTNSIVSVTQDYVYIYNQNCKEIFKSKTCKKNKKKINLLFSKDENLLGVCVLNFDVDNPIIAFPDETKGFIHIYNIKEKSSQIIDAHVGMTKKKKKKIKFLK